MIVVATACLILLAPRAESSFALIEDFESLTPGDVDLQGGWDVGSGTIEVRVDPGEPSNQVLAVTTDSARAHRTAVIHEGTERMMFLRFRISAQQNYSLGLSPFSRPSEFGDFAVEIGMSNADFDLRSWDEGSQYEELATLTPDIWYNMWVLVNAELNTYQIWLNSTPGASADPSADKLQTSGGLDEFTFRTGASSDLRTFFIKTGGGNSSVNSGPLFIDDLHIENRGTLNLSNPLVHPGPEITQLELDVSSGLTTIAWKSSEQRSYRITASANLADGFSEVLRTGVAGGAGLAETSVQVDLAGRTEVYLRVEEE